MGTIPDLDRAQPELGLLTGLYAPNQYFFCRSMPSVGSGQQLWGLTGKKNTHGDGQSLQSTEETCFAYCYESKWHNQEITCKVSALKDQYGVIYTDNAKVETRSLQ